MTLRWQRIAGLQTAFEDETLDLGHDRIGQLDPHLCCGSAGTYSVLQPALSKQLRENKLRNLEAKQPQVITTANIGCLTHLQAGTSTPVRHWIELLDERMS